ncbi:hypothetical protein FRC20_001054 [Serendipita sp. 405]|nr:hypothetical protein FRC15_002218 [Serendipita sp. 397]KAG8790939.1 hypothetical protein FRC16_000656 [Serendipita sp. 398]KAG8854356.1 hypothetical protein FRC20_001054 [Serendipita sp. 405]
MQKKGNAWRCMMYRSDNGGAGGDDDETLLRLFPEKDDKPRDARSEREIGREERGEGEGGRRRFRFPQPKLGSTHRSIDQPPIPFRFACVHAHMRSARARDKDSIKESLVARTP